MEQWSNVQLHVGFDQFVPNDVGTFFSCKIGLGCGDSCILFAYSIALSLFFPTEVHAYLALRGLKRRQNDNYFDKHVFGDLWGSLRRCCTFATSKCTLHTGWCRLDMHAKLHVLSRCSPHRLFCLGSRAICARSHEHVIGWTMLSLCALVEFQDMDSVFTSKIA